MNITKEEAKIIRKALQLMLTAHLAVETNEGEPFKDTKVDDLLRRFREEEEGATNESVTGEV